jgi:hypothetical protein
MRVENLEGGTDVFPHSYGTIPAAAVSHIHRSGELTRRWRLPDLPEPA